MNTGWYQRHPSFTQRENITSPGGTTAAALFACEEGGLRTVFQKAVWAAYRSVVVISTTNFVLFYCFFVLFGSRSLEMGGNNSNVGPGRFQQHIQPTITMSKEIVAEMAQQLKSQDG